jgi:hypothetical protein
LIQKRAAFNAWITKDNCLFFTTTLLNEVNIDMIECVMAHELAHYALEHIKKHQAVSTATSTVFEIANIFLPGIGWVNMLVNPTITRSYGRSQELEADRQAIAFLEETGMIHPKTKFIELLEHLEQHSQERGFTLWATHPSIEDRIKNIRYMDKGRRLVKREPIRTPESTTAQIEPQPMTPHPMPEHMFRVTSDPPGAEIWAGSLIPAKYYGVTPKTLSLYSYVRYCTDSCYAFQLKKAGYRDSPIIRRTRKEEDRLVHFKLVPIVRDSPIEPVNPNQGDAMN